MDRRGLIRGAYCFGLLSLAGRKLFSSEEVQAAGKAFSGSPDDAVRELHQGNERFYRRRTTSPRRDSAAIKVSAASQSPFAAILSCSDSRVVPELVFDQGIGDLFVIRVAGNLLSGGGTAVKGSLEYAVEVLGVKAIMVLGHSECGAISAAVNHDSNKKSHDEHIPDLLANLLPAIGDLKGVPDSKKVSVAVERNVRAQMAKIKAFDEEVTHAVARKKIALIGGIYDLETGKVDFIV